MSKVKFFRKHFYKLKNTAGWATVEINGIQMHRTVRFSPEIDAERKVNALNPKRGDIVFDICTGLGYTSIFLARRLCRVVTIEKDRNIIQIAKKNIYSKPFFENLDRKLPPDEGKIKLIIADATEFIKKFRDNYFDAILHDPPRFNIAEELYSSDFYKELYRVLKNGHRLLHYIGSPQTRFSNKDIIRNIIKRLKQVGFRKIIPVADIECFLVMK